MYLTMASVRLSLVLAVVLASALLEAAQLPTHSSKKAIVPLYPGVQQPQYPAVRQVHNQAASHQYQFPGVKANQSPAVRQHQYPAGVKPYHPPATIRQHQRPVAVKQYVAPVKQYHNTAPAKQYQRPIATKQYQNSAPVKQYQRPIAVKQYPNSAAVKQHQRPVAVKQYQNSAPVRQYQHPAGIKQAHFPAGIKQYQYPGVQQQYQTPVKIAHTHGGKQKQVIKKRLTPAQLRQIQQWQIAVQLPPGTQVQPGTGGSPPGPAIPGHIWIQVPVPPQGSYPPPQVTGPPTEQPEPVDPVPEAPAENEQPITEVTSETEEPQGPYEPEEPQGPYEPEQPQVPLEPEQPQGPYEPEQPQGPFEPEQPQGPYEPEQPQGPFEPEQPQGPYEPEQPQGPYEPEQPYYPEEPAQPEEILQPEQPETSVPIPEPGNQPIQPLPEETYQPEVSPDNGGENIPENVNNSGALSPGNEDGGDGSWTDAGGDPESQGVPDAAMAELLQSCLEPRGQYASPSACNKFINCWDDYAVEQQCPGGLVFSEEGFCDYPENVDCGSRESGKPGISGEGECPTPYGHYRSTESCGLFYVCVGGSPVKFECPEGLNYNTELGVCDYPNRVDCGGTPSDRPPPQAPAPGEENWVEQPAPVDETSLPEAPEEVVPESSEEPRDPNSPDPAKKFFKLKRVPAKSAARPPAVRRAPYGAPLRHPSLHFNAQHVNY